ncbi:MAG: hypothetical protein H6745_05035 [Deltaproteobacteria bacterium]|nr:hypothetical protein [Deltaproteobacteria bacterium]
MAERPTVNMPSAEQLVRLIRGALRHTALFAPPVLIPWKDILGASASSLEDAIAPRVKAAGVTAARAAASAADAEHDRAQRFFYGLLSAFGAAPDPAARAASSLLLATLYPDKLAPVTAAWADEVAAGPTFAKKLALPEVAAALATLTPLAPGLPAAGQAIVAAAAALGAALDALDRVLVDDAGKQSSQLFEARLRAHQQLALFGQVVQTAAYPADSPEHKAARLALIGPYLRYLAAVPGRPTAVPDALPADADTPADGDLIQA